MYIVGLCCVVVMLSVVLSDVPVVETVLLGDVQGQAVVVTGVCDEHSTLEEHVGH